MIRVRQSEPPLLLHALLQTHLLPGARMQGLIDSLDMPMELDRQLRMNRRGSLLPDRPGDMWMQLIYAHEADQTLFEGNKTGV